MSREITVWADWLPPCPTRMGDLRSSLVRGKEVFAFTYDPAWLAGNPSRKLGIPSAGQELMAPAFQAAFP